MACDLYRKCKCIVYGVIRDFPSEGMVGIPQPDKNSLILPPHLENSPSQ